MVVLTRTGVPLASDKKIKLKKNSIWLISRIEINYDKEVSRVLMGSTDSWDNAVQYMQDWVLHQNYQRKFIRILDRYEGIQVRYTPSMGTSTYPIDIIRWLKDNTFTEEEIAAYKTQPRRVIYHGQKIGETPTDKAILYATQLPFCTEEKVGSPQ